MTASASELSALVKTLCGGSSSDMLIQLTNNDPNATTINETVLTHCCNLAIGSFRVRSKLEPDTSTPNYSHLDILTEGVFYFLETAKSRDSGMIELRGKNFRMGCQMLAEGHYFPATIGVVPQRSEEYATSYTDFDRNRIAFKEKRNNVNNIEYKS